MALGAGGGGTRAPGCLARLLGEGGKGLGFPTSRGAVPRPGPGAGTGRGGAGAALAAGRVAGAPGHAWAPLCW